ncbi:type 1 periplasmic-binding domain-containing protein [Saccharopolyspora gregorii]|uniref:hypothetical protein n=1 Tax=Saccharopolyspora gregorii TaxID=33914 RepID=UPI0021AC087D|nr:hypothetical protein [Saccharopolyspora gregorii]
MAGGIRFHRYALASYLLQHELEPPEPDEVPNRQARALLRTYARSRLLRLKSRSAEPDGAGSRFDAAATRVEPLALPWYLALPSLVLFYLLPPVIQRGVVLRRPARWFLRQHYLSPRESADFASFAQRLLTTPSVHENALQVRKFLVHALLEDLADAYARRVWRWRWMRRDNYPVLLLQGVTPGTTGELLIRLINDVRNETGAWDPLLVVASGTEELPHDDPPAEPLTVQGWQHRLQEARRKRSPTAWYLPIRVEDPPTDVEPRPAFPRGQFPIRTTRARILRFVPVAIAGVVVLGAGTWYLHEWNAHCRTLLPWTEPGLSRIDPDGFGGARGECVGVSAGYMFSPPENADDKTREELLGLQDRVRELNAAAEERHRNEPELPYPTIVYFSVLTTSNSDSTTLAAALEELRGVVDAQNRSRLARLPMRVVIANGGEEMRHGAEVAERIGELARAAEAENIAARGESTRSGTAREATSPVVGVVGLGGSRKTTKEAISVLGRHGLPSIGITTSEDHMWKSSKLYFQIAPPNRDQARVVGEYLQHHVEARPRRVIIFKDPGDDYSVNLAEDLHHELTANRGIAADTTDDLAELEFACGRDSVVFFAGRSEQLNELLTRDRCDPGNPARLIAGDDVTKYVLNRRVSNPDAPRPQLDYVSFNKLPHAERADDDADQGRSALARDAIDLLSTAINQFKDDPLPLTGITTWNELSHVGGMSRATTGAIVYDPTGSDPSKRQVPVNKAITIEHIDSAGRSRTLLVCGDHQANDNRPAGCTWLGG